MAERVPFVIPIDLTRIRPTAASIFPIGDVPTYAVELDWTCSRSSLQRRRNVKVLG